MKRANKALEGIKRKAFSMMSIMGMGSASWSGRHGKSFAKEGYTENSVGFACLTKRSNGVASIPLKAFKNGEHVPDHPLQKLLNRPNKMRSGNDFWKEVVAFHDIAGQALIEAVRSGMDDRGAPLSLVLWEPYNLRVIHDDGFYPVGYEVREAKRSKFFPVDELTKSTNLLHWKIFNPLNRWAGMPLLYPAAMAIDQHNESSRWNKSLLENKGAPSGAFISEGNLNDKQFDQMKAQVDENFSGASNSGRPLLLEGKNMKFVQLSMTPSDLDWLEGRNCNARDICSVTGVPGQLVNIKGEQTYANFSEARIAFTDEVLMPLSLELVQELNSWLVPMYEEEGLEIRRDLSDVPALDDKRANKMTALQPVTFLTDNEKRHELNYTPYDENKAIGAADKLYQNASSLPLGFASSMDEEMIDGSDEEKIAALTDLGMCRKEAIAIIRNK